ISQRRRIEREVETRGRQQAAVAELGRCALGIDDLRVLMNAACLLVSQTLGSEFCQVLQLTPDGNAFFLVAGVGWEEGLAGSALVPLGAESQAGYTLVADKAVVVEDLSRETRFSEADLLREHGVVSGMSVIIPGVDNPFGVLASYTATRRSFTDDDIHFLET